MRKLGLLIISTFLFSCGSDDSGNENLEQSGLDSRFIGSWTLVSEETEETEFTEREIVEGEELECIQGSTLVFNEEGTYEEDLFLFSGGTNGTFCTLFSFSGTFETLDDTQLIRLNDEFNEADYIFENEGDTLMLIEDFNRTGTGLSLIHI